MASVGARRGRLYIDFRYKNVRYREQTSLLDTPVNRRQAGELAKRMDAEILLGTFDYQTYFPDGNQADKFKVREHLAELAAIGPQRFEAFAETWFAEKKIEWSDSYAKIVRGRLDKYLIPFFKGRALVAIDKAEIMRFRTHLAEQPGKRGEKVGASCINNVMLPLRQILREAADRFDFPDPWKNIKHVRERRKEINPFNIEEVRLILERVRADYRAYYTVRFFTGLRSGEVDGLTWKCVDFERRQILVRQALVQGKIVPTKTDGSSREIEMSDLVYDTLKKHEEEVGHRSEFVFSTATGHALHNRNVTRRIWYPLLDLLGLQRRRPYQTRHTAATLWLAAGENPEWIARQMGHTTTKMLFTRYSRYVPNLTRKDGSAMEKLLQAEFENNKTIPGPSHDSEATHENSLNKE